jgi:hypothetical protein
MNLANKIARTKGVTVDREAKRKKEGLICCFCEFARELIDTSATDESQVPNDTFDRPYVDFRDQEFSGGNYYAILKIHKYGTFMNQNQEKCNVRLDVSRLRIDFERIADSLKKAGTV